MLKGRCEKLKFQKTLSLSYRKIETSKSKTKVLKKEPREMENKKKIKRRIKKMILGLIILKHNLDLFILSFGTINPGLHYVPEKSILIECGYLN